MAKTKIKAKTKVKVKVKVKVKTKVKAKPKPQAKAKIVAKPKVKAKPAVKAKPEPKAKPAIKMSVQKRAEFLLQPLADRVVVRVLKGPKKTPGGLFIPDTATVSGHLEGEVLAVGSGLRNKKGSVRPLDLSTGDHVLFPEFSGTDIKEGDTELRILRENEIFGTVK